MKRIIPAIIVIAVLLAIFHWNTSDHEWSTIMRVVDGDTLVLDGGERVRLLDVDTPEKFDSPKLDRDAKRTGMSKEKIKAMGEQASEFTRKLCEGKRCWLEYGKRRTDKYGRTLAYVHLEDGRVVNDEIPRNYHYPKKP